MLNTHLNAALLGIFETTYGAGTPVDGALMWRFAITGWDNHAPDGSWALIARVAGLLRDVGHVYPTEMYHAIDAAIKAGSPAIYVDPVGPTFAHEGSDGLVKYSSAVVEEAEEAEDKSINCTRPTRRRR